MFEKQLHNYIYLSILLFLSFLFVRELSLEGTYLGLSTTTWLIVAIAVPIIHQLYVWLFWRLELYHGWVSKNWGSNGFHYYCVGFALIFASRLFSIIPLSIADASSLSSINTQTGVIAGSLVLIPGLYLMYSVKHYFGFERAFGADHFDEKFRSMPLIRKGIFRFTPNAMYVFGFFILYVPGLWARSEAALLAAVFNHAYIWVHYYCTEKPDMRKIYGS
jgi:hypothetical protein